MYANTFEFIHKCLSKLIKCLFWGRATFGLTVFFQPKLKNFPVWILYKKQPSEFRRLLYSSQNIYAHYDEEVLTKHVRLNHDKTYTIKSWQNIYDEIMTKHLRWSHDKTFTMKSWQNIYEEVMTKHLRLCLTKHLRWSHDKAFTFMFDKTFTMKSWQNIYDEVMTKHIRWSHDKTYTKKSWQSIYV